MFHRIRAWTDVVLRRDRFEDAMADEMRAHLDMRIEDLVSAGTPRSRAERQARIEFGSVEGAKDACRDARGASFIESLHQDVRYALRGFKRSPGFAMLCIGIMALGIGANTAVFSVVNAVLLEPLPYREPDRIVTLSYTMNRAITLNALKKQIAVPDFEDWHDQSTVFEAMAFYGTRRASVMAGPAAEYARVTRPSPDFFRVLSVQPIVRRRGGESGGCQSCFNASNGSRRAVFRAGTYDASRTTSARSPAVPPYIQPTDERRRGSLSLRYRRRSGDGGMTPQARDERKRRTRGNGASER